MKNLDTMAMIAKNFEMLFMNKYLKPRQEIDLLHELTIFYNKYNQIADYNQKHLYGEDYVKECYKKYKKELRDNNK